MITMQIRRIPLSVILYAMYLYFSGLSFRSASRALGHDEEEPHLHMEVGPQVQAQVQVLAGPGIVRRGPRERALHIHR
jgi:hypothetical protein